MLKISVAEPASHNLTLRREGRVIGPWVDEVRQSCQQVLREGRALRLDLAEVEFRDAEAVALLGELRSRGVELRRTPTFIAEQLRLGKAGL